MGDLDVDALLTDLPSKKAVLLPVDGKPKELTLDFAPEVLRERKPRPSRQFSKGVLALTPRPLLQANAIAKTLGGDASFVGMYGAADIVIMSLRHPPASAKVNKSEL